jgi:hypothetical protein
MTLSGKCSFREWGCNPIFSFLGLRFHQYAKTFDICLFSSSSCLDKKMQPVLTKTPRGKSPHPVHIATSSPHCIVALDGACSSLPPRLHPTLLITGRTILRRQKTVKKIIRPTEKTIPESSNAAVSKMKVGVTFPIR